MKFQMSLGVLDDAGQFVSRIDGEVRRDGSVYFRGTDAVLTHIRFITDKGVEVRAFSPNTGTRLDE